MTTVPIPFYAAVAVAGAIFLLVQALTRHLQFLREVLPIPLAAGLIGAFLILCGRGFGWNIEVPHQGTEVDFLIALLTTNMGLHLTRRVLAAGLPAFGVFLSGGIALFGLQLAAAYLVAQAGPSPLETAILTGPLSFLGAPYNLNPPAQVPPIADLLQPAFADPEASARGMMMLGVLLGPLVASYLARRFFSRAGFGSPKPPAQDQETPRVSISSFAKRETTIVVLILIIVSAAFGIQAALLALVPGLTDDHVPVIVIAYLLGGATRMAWIPVAGPRAFPETALTALLLGPTMSIVLTYAIMSVPLHMLANVSPPMLLAGVLVISCSAAVGALLFPVFARILDPYYAAVVATAFVAVTTAWGPAAMSFLRRSTDEAGEVEPMPAILPLSAFYIFPWTAILLTELVFVIFR
ncbi:sodium/glutamate symporter [Chelativorans sp. AA-79]|uniref:sodium/glutamate symporter n=1 Tax=Chelativorans sp. AA-79 TaxID=3028735 RepID=UPI0023F95664|nr:sodium/glutamate symporter [Chelativorans sp. AA-79]WEX07989.1 sodium/glutamate symporter [Chelativorans sp. AA-79]